MRFVAFALACAACGGSGDPLVVTTSFAITDFSGNGPSPLDPLKDQTIALEITWHAIDHNMGDGSDPAGCKSTVVGSIGCCKPERVATGTTATLVQTEILDRLDEWYVTLQLCDTGAGQSSIKVDSAINELNLSFGCFGVPASAEVRGGDGYPAITSFTAAQCGATILDVVNNRVLGNTSFSVTIATGPDRVP